MQVIESPQQMLAFVSNLKRAGKKIGFVPTMGFLHEGHLSLVDIAGKDADVVVLSIFVNPMQFGPNEDFTRYPRNFERDIELCRARGVDCVFNPPSDMMYDPNRAVYLDEDRVSHLLCGSSRPGHFRGVLTVVAKLFNIIQPDVAVFGQKDAQQVKLIQLMIRDLNFPVVIRVAPIVREPDGLAMSSRNAYLSANERKDALCLFKALEIAEEFYNEGERNAGVIINHITKLITSVSSVNLDFVEIVDQETFSSVISLNKPVFVLLAVWVGKTRLIDNVILS